MTSEATPQESHRQERHGNDAVGSRFLRLAQEEYGIEITKVQEIILLGEITRVPQTPEYIKGLINRAARSS